MATNNQSTPQTEDFRLRLESLYLLLQMTCCAIEQGVFNTDRQEEQVAALNRIADSL